MANLPPVSLKLVFATGVVDTGSKLTKLLVPDSPIVKRRITEKDKLQIIIKALRNYAAMMEVPNFYTYLKSVSFFKRRNFSSLIFLLHPTCFLILRSDLE